MLQPGTHIGRYEIQRRLGRGGMGTVYVAHDPILGRMVALKLFQGDLDVIDAPDRFAREARSAASLSHTHIVTVYDYGEFEAQPYIVMEYVQGETLASIIRRKAPIDLVTRLRWLEELCAGVGHAHRGGVIHRDIKPGNLMVDRSGRLKVLDFGVARMLGTLSSNGTALIGTPGYMAPEQILGSANDHRVDLFSIGVVAYELLSYTQAFPGDSIPAVTHRILSDEPLPLVEVCPEAGQAAAAVVHRALKKSVNERFADAEMMATALREVRREFEGSLASEPTLAPGLVELADGAEAKTPGSGAKPTPVTGQRSREEVAKRRTAQIEAAVSKGRMLMESGQLDDALESCLLALALDEEHPEAQALDQLIRRRQAESHADEMVRDARIELDRGALTAADGLLQQARALVPDGPEVRKLERDLRLARVEQERVRQRAQLLQKIVEDADRALAQGQLEVAVVLAGEGLALDPQSDRARLIKEEAARRLIDDSAALSTATVVRPAVMNPTVIRPAADETTRVRPVAAEPTVIRPVVSAAPTKQVEAVRPPSPAVAPAHLAQQRSSAVSSRVTTAWATVAGLISARSGAMGTHLRGLSPHQKRMLLWGAGGAAAVIALGVVAVLWSNSAPAPVARQQVVIEAVPWATVAGIQAEDGTPVTVPPDASTPFVIDLPPGRYTVRLVGPSPDSAVKVLTVQAEAGGSPPVVTESFVQMTPEDYFEQYLSPLPSQATDASAPAPAEPRP